MTPAMGGRTDFKIGAYAELTRSLRAAYAKKTVYFLFFPEVFFERLVWGKKAPLSSKQLIKFDIVPAHGVFFVSQE